MTEFDTVVAGDGIAGLTAALLLAGAGQRVALLAPGEAPAAPAPDAAIEPRCYAITPAARAVLAAAGAWSRVDAARCGPFDGMEVWDAHSSGRLSFDPPPAFEGPMGHIVEHRNLAAALGGAVEACRDVTVHASRLINVGNGTPRAVELDDGTRLDARLVVGADGASSRVREALGIAVNRRDYAQLAVVCNVTTTTPHGRIARQRFLSSGPLAFLPLPDPHGCSIVWSATHELGATLASEPDAAFRARLGAALDGALGTVTEAGERFAVPLARQSARRLVAAGAALIGDAAHVVHPLAGQGLNLGLLDAAALAECVGRPRTADWPRAGDLARYQRWRRSEALAMTVVTDGLDRLFRARGLPLKVLRGAGMRLTDGLTPLKHWLIARAMGLEGDVPRLGRA